MSTVAERVFTAGDLLEWGPANLRKSGELVEVAGAELRVLVSDGEIVTIPSNAYRLKVTGHVEPESAAPAADLFGDELETAPTPEPAPVQSARNKSVLELPVDAVLPFGLNPRQDFPEEDLHQLGESIRRDGQDTPIVVRTAKPQVTAEFPGVTHEIIAGERRWRASKLVGLATILAVDRGEVDDDAALAEAVRENAKRRGLGPLEEVRSIEYMQARGFTQERIGELMGDESGPRSQEWISHTLGLRRLPPEVQELLKDGQLSRSHGRAIAVKFGRYPKVALRVAKWAVERGVTSKYLETGTPFEAELQSEGLLREMRPQPTLPVAPPVAPTTTVTTTTTTERTETRTEPAPAATSESTAAGSAPVPTAAEIATRRAEAAASEKPGALKSAEEKVAERSGAPTPPTPAVPTGWEGKPVAASIPEQVYDRVEEAGLGVVGSLTTFCDLADAAFEHDLEPAACVSYLKRFLALCYGPMASDPESILVWLEARSQKDQVDE